jgi:hypothetical protein
MYNYVRATLLAGIIAATACSDPSTAPDPLSASRNGDPAAVGREVARMIAVAMKDRAIQESVRDAMRASEMAQHKIELQAFLTSSAGRRLAVAAARAGNISDSEFAAIVRKLPTLDFFVPNSADRKQWRTGKPLAVGALFDDDAWTTTAFRQDGEPFTYDGRSANQTALFLLLPEEPKGKRVHPQARVPGDAIQDENDGELAFAMTVPGPNGAQYIDGSHVPMAARVNTSPPLPSTVRFVRSNSSVLDTKGAYIYGFLPYFDDGLSGACEVHWENYYVPNGTGSWTQHTRWPLSGEVSGGCGGTMYWDIYNGYSLAARKILNAWPGDPSDYPYSKIAIEAWESDASSGDDAQGWTDFFEGNSTQFPGSSVSILVCEHNNGCSYKMQIDWRNF